jgi:hypothetical protein
MALLVLKEVLMIVTYSYTVLRLVPLLLLLVLTWRVVAVEYRSSSESSLLAAQKYYYVSPARVAPLLVATHAARIKNTSSSSVYNKK